MCGHRVPGLVWSTRFINLEMSPLSRNPWSHDIYQGFLLESHPRVRPLPFLVFSADPVAAPGLATASVDCGTAACYMIAHSLSSTNAWAASTSGSLGFKNGGSDPPPSRPLSVTDHPLALAADTSCTTTAIEGSRLDGLQRPEPRWNIQWVLIE
jgi:hypothetical protein